MLIQSIKLLYETFERRLVRSSIYAFVSSISLQMAFEVDTVRFSFILHLHASFVDLSEELSDFLSLDSNSLIK